MPPATPNPFTPKAGETFSKSEINRSGARLREVRIAIRVRGVDAVDGWSSADLDRALRAVTWWRLAHARPLSKVAANLRYHVEKEGGYVDGRIDVTQRLKRLPTMIGKLEREPKMKLSRMADVGGVRAKLPTLDHVNAVSRRLRKTWTIVQTKDYVSDPKDSGYRAIHHVVRRDSMLVEVQLRTILQDAWANQVEEDGRIRGAGLKFGEGEAEIHNYYRAMSEAFAALDRGEPLGSKIEAELVETFRKARGLLDR